MFAALSSQDINSAHHIMQLMLEAGLDVPSDFIFQVRTEEQRILEAAETGAAAVESEQAQADPQELEAM